MDKLLVKHRLFLSVPWQMTQLILDFFFLVGVLSCDTHFSLVLWDFGISSFEEGQMLSAISFYPSCEMVISSCCVCSVCKVMWLPDIVDWAWGEGREGERKDIILNLFLVCGYGGILPLDLLLQRALQRGEGNPF